MPTITSPRCSHSLIIYQLWLTNLYIAKHRSQHNIPGHSMQHYFSNCILEIFSCLEFFSLIVIIFFHLQFYLSICHMLWSARLLINVWITLGARYQSLLIGVRPLWINWGWATLGCQPHFDWTIWRSVRLAEAKTESVGRGGDGEAFSVRRGPVLPDFAPPILSTLTLRVQFRSQQFGKSSFGDKKIGLIKLSFKKVKSKSVTV